MKGKVPVWDAQAGRVGSPRPSPLLRHAEPVWGGGREGVYRAGSCLGILSGEGGVTLASKYREPDSHSILARKNRRLGSHLSSASYFGKLFRQVISATYSGISIWRGFIASKFSRFIQRVFQG